MMMMRDNMKDINHVINHELNHIEEKARKYDETIYHSLDDVKVSVFKRWCFEHFKSNSIPDKYLEIISKIDGFDFDGLSFYSLNDDANNNIYESNEIYWENENLKEYLFIGEDSISWYGISFEKGKFLILDKPSGEVMEEYADIECLFINAFKSVL